jgi:chromosome segregation ATPase
MNITATVYHIFFMVIAIGTAVWAFVKIYIKQSSSTLKESFSEQITGLRESLEKKNSSDIKELNDSLTKEINHVKQELRKESSTEAVKAKVRDFFDGEMKLIEKDVKEIKEVSTELKKIMMTQQETLIAIQMSITELKPRLTNLEGRVEKLEKQLDR